MNQTIVRSKKTSEPQALDTLLRKARLKFDDDLEEALFLANYNVENNSALRLLLLPVAFATAALALLYLFVESNIYSYNLHLAAFAMALVGWVLTHLPRLVRYNQFICWAFVAALLLACSVVQWVSPPKIWYYDMFNVTLMIAVSFLQLRFRYTVAAVCLTLVIRISGLSVYDRDRLFEEIVPLFTLIGFLGFIVLTSYVLEKKKRQTFLTRLRVQSERERADALLSAVLPESAAESVRQGRTRVQLLAPECDVIFVELRPRGGQQLNIAGLEQLDTVFRRFDAIIRDHQYETIKTFGYEYFFVADVFSSKTSLAGTVGSALRDIAKVCAELNWEVRIGADSGSAAAGIVGVKNLAFDVWGQTVNIAARLKHSASWGEVAASERFAKRNKLGGPALRVVTLKGVGDVTVQTIPVRDFLGASLGA